MSLNQIETQRQDNITQKKVISIQKIGNTKPTFYHTKRRKEYCGMDQAQAKWTGELIQELMISI